MSTKCPQKHDFKLHMHRWAFSGIKRTRSSSKTSFKTLRFPIMMNNGTRVFRRVNSMGGTRTFEVGRGQQGGKADGIGRKENGFYRTFNWGKLAAGALAVNDRKYEEIQHSLCSVLTHFVDFYIKFTLQQWTGRVDRAHIIFLTTTGGGQQPRGRA